MKWPQIPRPWNPAYHEVYDAMTEQERQASFKIDLALAGLAILFALCLGGCSKVEKGTDPLSKMLQDPGDTSPAMVSPVGTGTAIREAGEALVMVDEGTGCQYLMRHGLTPRMAYSSDGRYVHVGCMVRGFAVEIE